MLRPAIEKTAGQVTRSKDKNNYFMVVRNVATDKSCNRFKLIGLEVCLPMQCTKIDETSYQFPCNASAEVLQFADETRHRDIVDKEHIVDMIKLVSAAHCRNLIIGDLTSYNIGISSGGVPSKLINVPHSKLWNGKPVIFEGICNNFHAPEIHQSGKMTMASDIYSLALHWIIAGTGQLIDRWHDMNYNTVRNEAIKLCKYSIQREMLELNPDRRPPIKLVQYAYASEKEGPSINWSVEYQRSQKLIQNVFRGQSDALQALTQCEDNNLELRTTVLSVLPSILSYVNMEVVMDTTSSNVVHCLELVHSLLTHDPWSSFLPGDTGTFFRFAALCLLPDIALLQTVWISCSVPFLR